MPVISDRDVERMMSTCYKLGCRDREAPTLDARIAELEAALRALLEHDEARFGYEGALSDVERHCREVLDRPASSQLTT